MKYGFIKPEWIHYAKKWDINWFSLSLRKKVWITPQQVTWTLVFCMIFGIVISFSKRYER